MRNVAHVWKSTCDEEIAFSRHWENAPGLSHIEDGQVELPLKDSCCRYPSFRVTCRNAAVDTSCRLMSPHICLYSNVSTRIGVVSLIHVMEHFPAPLLISNLNKPPI